MNSPDHIGWKARIACLLYESLTVVAVVIIGVIIPQTLIAAMTGTAASSRLLLAHLFLLLLLYFAWQWTHGGQTLAMKTWRIRLVNNDGGPLRPAQALLRYAAAWPGTLMLGAGFLWALIDQDRQFLHDRIAGTMLTRAPKN